MRNFDHQNPGPRVPLAPSLVAKTANECVLRGSTAKEVLEGTGTRRWGEDQATY